LANVIGPTEPKLKIGGPVLLLWIAMWFGVLREQFESVFWG
jgi:hypothetical protein